ncbi:MAG: hypothetical protein LBN05_02595, partial [Oscillospiraceae bacterium]|nr:hypothetical protein [Oscillospiraceae bacterium]
MLDACAFDIFRVLWYNFTQTCCARNSPSGLLRFIQSPHPVSGLEVILMAELVMLYLILVITAVIIK